MLKYLVIHLADDSVSYCHYNTNADSDQFISKETLETAIRFGMLENLNIQYVYPNRPLPEGYDEIIEMIDHVKIMPSTAHDVDSAEIVVCNSISELEECKLLEEQIVILRLGAKDINEFVRVYDAVKDKCSRINIVITDVDKFTEAQLDEYKASLNQLGKKLKDYFIKGDNVQLNLLTDRLLLNSMNNCNAGDEVIAIMPNGRFYPCAGFYNDNPNEDFGDLDRGVQIKNRQLFKLINAPICRHCDAFQCRRCAWMNRKTTLEINTPSHEQCVVAHLERNASRELLHEVRNYGDFLPETIIDELPYLDPFDVRKTWIK